MKRRGPMIMLFALGMISCSPTQDKETPIPEASALLPITGATASQTAEVDATSRTDWTGFDFDNAATIGVADFPANSSWDIAFKRTSIKMNSNVKMQIVDQDFAALELAPKTGYRSDEPVPDPAAIETSGLAFHQNGSWYLYDISTHLISSRGLVYVLETNDGRYFKLKLKDYYNKARLPAYLNFEFQELKGVQP